MAAPDCSPVRAAELSSELFRLKSAYEQTVRQGVAVGGLKWVVGDNVVPADYFDGLVGLGAVGVGAALRVGGASGVQGEVGSSERVAQGVNGFGDTISVFRKMSASEAEATLNTLRLQPPIFGSNFRKYLSESARKVENFRNAGVLINMEEKTLEFILDKKGCDLVTIQPLGD